MSTITIDAVPDALTALLATPEGMARARAAVLAAFPELTPDTRTLSEKALDAVRVAQKARNQAKQAQLVADVLVDRRQKALVEEKVA